MRRIVLIVHFIFINLLFSFNQTEGWSSTCSANTPSVSEVMIDACGNEFTSEYTVLRTGTQSFDISRFGMRVINPTNNAFIGDVTIQKGNINAAALDILTAAAGAICPYGTVFRDVFAPPYNGVVPPNSAILFFNNKEATDVSYLSPNTLTELCGSKVFVAFGDLVPQSRGASIFRNYPQNGSCGNGGCLRQIMFQFEGQNSPFCTQLTYDIKKLPHLNTTNPPAGFNEGSYIRPKSDGSILYGGGNLTGNGVCMPPDPLTCVIPTQPDFGKGFWNVLVYEGLNTFKGFYQAKGNHPASIPASTGSFEYNTARDGWASYDSPSEAHATYGALKTFDGCNVQKDSFSIFAKRQGFPCGNYDLKLVKYDDNARILIDANGDGTFEYNRTFNAPACSADCGTTIWSGALGSDSKITIFSHDIRGDFNTTLIFDKKTTSPSPIKIASTITPATACNTPTGGINLTITGGVLPYTHTWAGVTAIPNNALSGTNLASGVYTVVVKDNSGCRDSARILVPQTNTVVAKAGNDTIFCAGGTAILRGSATGGTGALTYEWTTENGSLISNQATPSVTPSISTTYALKASDANGCFNVDSVFVKLNDAPYVTMSVSTKDSICNDEKPVLKVTGAQTYTWNTFPPIAGAALSSRTGDNIELFALFLPAPVYQIIAEGTDANGCKNAVQTIITVIPLPNATIDPVPDTLCSNGAPRALSFMPATGVLNPRIQLTNAPCVNCVIGNQFYPSNSGVGKFTIYNEVTNASGCKSRPAIEINVKSCNTCLKTDSTILVGLTCNPAAVGAFPVIKKNILGCDSVIITNFILAPNDTIRINKTTCDSIKQGVVIEPYKNIYGCDSVIKTTTTWIKPSITTLLSTSCNPLDTGTFTQKLVNTGGCDSIVVSKVTLSTRDLVTINKTTCYAAFAGTTTTVYKNRYNCDSVVTTITQLLKSDTIYLLSTSCNPRDTGTIPKSLRNTAGCDSIIYIKVSLSKGDTTKTTAKTCDPTRVGQVSFLPLKKTNGCDSIVATTLVLNRRDSINISRTICSGDSIKFGALWYKNRGIYPIFNTNTEGCDSITVLNLDTRKNDETIINTTTCNAIKTGQTIERFQNITGCDSIVITRTSFVASTMDFDISISKPITCNSKNDGQISLKMIKGGTQPYIVRWMTTDTGFTLKNIRAGLYRVTVTDAEGCQVSDSFRMTEPVPLSIQAAGIAPKCFEDKIGSIRFDTINGGEKPFTLLVDRGRPYTITTFPFVLPNIEVGKYPVFISDKNSCSTDSAIQVNAGKKVLLDLIKSATIDLGDSLALNVTTNSILKSTKWTPSTGLACDSCLFTTIKPTVSTIYTLSVKDIDGCQATETLNVLVDKKRRIFAPNSFSPNGDGENEIFTIFTDASVRRIKTLKVFNRWGNLLFESTDFTSGDTSKGWNGTFNGNNLATDVYVFFAEIEFIDGKKEVFQGDVALMR